jgi:hypothetical protein
MLLRADREADAFAVLSEATATLPDNGSLQFMLAEASRRVKAVADHHQLRPIAPDSALPLALDVLGRDPTNPEAIAAAAAVARRLGQPEIMLDVCQAALRRTPAHTLARYELAIAHALLGHPQDAKELIDVERFVRVVETATPDRFGDALAFEAALTGEIERNPTLTSDPPGKATKGGSQTSTIPRAGDDATDALLEVVRDCVDGFESGLSPDSAHAFEQHRPVRVRLRAWAVVVRGNGRQLSHIHPDGWLSGVYYVGAPEPDTEDPRRGALVLGSLEGTGLKFDPPWGVRDIQPARGRLVLFPSYTPHATRPTQSPEARTCISFDVIPIPTDTVTGVAAPQA